MVFHIGYKSTPENTIPPAGTQVECWLYNGNIVPEVIVSFDFAGGLSPKGKIYWRDVAFYQVTQ